jgi:hypothetical protein
VNDSVVAKKKASRKGGLNENIGHPVMAPRTPGLRDCPWRGFLLILFRSICKNFVKTNNAELYFGGCGWQNFKKRSLVFFSLPIL